MKYPFQTRGRVVEVFRYEAQYTDRRTGEVVTHGFPTHAEAQKKVELQGVGGKGTVTELDVSALEWLDGLEVASFDAAVDIYKAGEAAYRAQLTEAAQQSPEQLRADVDFISAMMGVAL